MSERKSGGFNRFVPARHLGHVNIVHGNHLRHSALLRLLSAKHVRGKQDDSISSNHLRRQHRIQDKNFSCPSPFIFRFLLFFPSLLHHSYLASSPVWFNPLPPKRSNVRLLSLLLLSVFSSSTISLYPPSLLLLLLLPLLPPCPDFRPLHHLHLLLKFRPFLLRRACQIGPGSAARKQKQLTARLDCRPGTEH